MRFHEDFFNGTLKSLHRLFFFRFTKITMYIIEDRLKVNRWETRVEGSSPSLLFIFLTISNSACVRE